MSSVLNNQISNRDFSQNLQMISQSAAACLHDVCTNALDNNKLDKCVK